MTGLPAWISAALQGRLENVSRGELRQRAQAISDTYRTGGSSEIVRSELDALAYAVVRMPATYAAVRAALAHTTEVIPDFRPQSILDVGAGPGTASWAAMNAWPSTLRTMLIDNNSRLLELARQLHAAIGRRDIAADVISDDMLRSLANAPAADLVMASYALTELAPAALDDTLTALWGRAARLLVIVEPGTMDGFRRILRCRDILLAAGATIIAPCSHESRCPLAGNERWCHVAARLPRSREHLIVKDASVPFEDEKFSYLVAGKGFADLRRGRRVLASPKVSKASVSLTLCAPDQPEERTVERREKEAYRIAKRLDWGDRLDMETR
jgi:ribosomal protein RSM22 (predicted rRNA methylase)